jgi:hypothetical protein
VLGDCGRGGFEQGERPGRFGPAGGGEHGAESSVGVADEVGAATHEFGDVHGVSEVVLAHGAGAGAVAASVDHSQGVAGFGEGPLSGPFAHSGGKGSVDQDDGRTGTQTSTWMPLADGLTGGSRS